jgi:hypothetical protein
MMGYLDDNLICWAITLDESFFNGMVQKYSDICAPIFALLTSVPENMISMS